MKRLNTPIKIISLAFTLPFAFVGCERTLSEDAILPGFATTAEIFTDDFIGMGSDFYLPFADAKPDVFSVDNTVGFESFSSIRMDVPNATDPSGGYAGAIFRVDGPPRDLSGYNALTFYVKASQGVSLASVGFGIDYLGDQNMVTMSDVNVGTSWTKVIVPIPDPSKLNQERGVFWFAAGTQGTNGSGYALWFDEIKYERFRTQRQVRSEINNGNTSTVKSFIGSSLTLTGFRQVYNLENGKDVSISSSPNYYTFVSSDTSVATVSATGIIQIVGTGKTDITAFMNGIESEGIVSVESLGNLPASPTPNKAPADVKSIFSDAYTQATTSNFTPGFGGSTTLTSVLLTSNGEVLQYTNNNFTGIMFDNIIDGSSMGFLHIDAYVQTAGTSIGIQIRDVGANKTIETDIFTGNPQGDDKDYRTNLSGFQTGVWKSFDIPLAGNITNQKNNLGAIIITGGPNFILDNIYFYK
ncbi:MAG: Ig-like domain-containing protein [Bacteroidota bacterium]|nr:Ig-like domain-containing protein [Bacteroidota bacterium]MDX5429958.1 Ig-like domain-containing protein [Bacteroidota bacterium]MDX5468731.1 Ig-like domain-containing protein [Bacteroidota bacterium]